MAPISDSAKRKGSMERSVLRLHPYLVPHRPLVGSLEGRIRSVDPCARTASTANVFHVPGPIGLTIEAIELSPMALMIGCISSTALGGDHAPRGRDAGPHRQPDARPRVPSHTPDIYGHAIDTGGDVEGARLTALLASHAVNDDRRLSKVAGLRGIQTTQPQRRNPSGVRLLRPTTSQHP